MAIDRKKIVNDLSKLDFKGNENGLIDAFNVYINQLPTSFWNGFAERLTTKIEDELLEATEFLLVNAAHECGYHTGYGIITSQEWKAVVEPMLENIPEDILHGAFAVFTAWGWSNAEVISIDPKKKMIIRAYDYYESDIMTYGKSSKMSAYMIRGVSAAFMDLAYGGDYDPSGKTGINTFNCIQTKGIECGDDYGEFIVEKK